MTLDGSVLAAGRLASARWYLDSSHRNGWGHGVATRRWWRHLVLRLLLLTLIVTTIIIRVDYDGVSTATGSPTNGIGARAG